jgi:hypothetical protein
LGSVWVLCTHLKIIIQIRNSKEQFSVQFQGGGGPWTPVNTKDTQLTTPETLEPLPHPINLQEHNRIKFLFSLLLSYRIRQDKEPEKTPGWAFIYCIIFHSSSSYSDLPGVAGSSQQCLVQSSGMLAALLQRPPR